MCHWKSIVEPDATVWRGVLAHAQSHGLVHGGLALTLYAHGVNRSPADAASLLADMVDCGELVACALDPAGVSHSVRAFRTAGPSAGQHDDTRVWAREHAHLWTYTATKGEDMLPSADGRLLPC